MNPLETIFSAETFLAEPQNLYLPINYTMSQQGKRLRPQLLLVANQMFDGSPEQVRDAAIGIELFHNFTLLHDDLMDQAPLRRGKPTVYTRFGDNAAILSGDTMFALAWRYFLKQPHPMLHQILTTFNETAIQVCEGQQYDMDFEQRDDVTIDEYINMIRLKTAVLLAAALKIGALYAQAPTDEIQKLYTFGIHLGLAFQLQDDYLDAFGDVASFGKATGQDIRDNKKTFLFLKALELADAATREQLQRFFHSGTSDQETKVAQVLQIYRTLHVDTATRQAIVEQFNLAQQALHSIAVDPAKKAPLESLLATLFDRNK